MKFLSIIIVIFLVMKTMAQVNFEKTYGSIEIDYANAVHQTSDHGYILAGYQQFGNASGDVYVIRTDEQGDTVWTRTYSRTWTDNALAVIESGSGYLLAGYTVMKTGPSETDI